MKLRKKVISTVLASSLILGSASFAADLTITNKNTKVETDFMDYITNNDIFFDLATSTDSYLVEFGGKLYEAAKAVELTSNGKTMKEVIADGSLVAVEDVVQGELKVESVSAITETGVDVTFAALAGDITGATVVVKNSKGETVAVKTANLKKDAKAASFDFVTAVTKADLVGTWTVDGKTFSFDEQEKVDEINKTAKGDSEVTFVAALEAAGIKNIDKEVANGYKNGVKEADPEVSSLAQVQAIIDAVNVESGKVKAVLTAAQSQLATEIKVFDALKAGFANVEADFSKDYMKAHVKLSDESVVSMAPTAGVASHLSLDNYAGSKAVTYKEIQAAIDRVNVYNMLLAVDKVASVTTEPKAEDLVKAKALVSKYAKDAYKVEDEFTAGDHAELRLQEIELINNINKATTKSGIRTAIQNLVDFEATLAEKYIGVGQVTVELPFTTTATILADFETHGISPAVGLTKSPLSINPKVADINNEEKFKIVESNLDAYIEEFKGAWNLKSTRLLVKDRVLAANASRVGTLADELQKAAAKNLGPSADSATKAEFIKALKNVGAKNYAESNNELYATTTNVTLFSRIDPVIAGGNTAKDIADAIDAIVDGANIEAVNKAATDGNSASLLAALKVLKIEKLEVIDANRQYYVLATDLKTDNAKPAIKTTVETANKLAAEQGYITQLNNATTAEEAKAALDGLNISAYTTGIPSKDRVYIAGELMEIRDLLDAKRVVVDAAGTSAQAASPIASIIGTPKNKAFYNKEEVTAYLTKDIDETVAEQDFDGDNKTATASGTTTTNPINKRGIVLAAVNATVSLDMSNSSVTTEGAILAKIKDTAQKFKVAEVPGFKKTPGQTTAANQVPTAAEMDRAEAFLFSKYFWTQAEIDAAQSSATPGNLKQNFIFVLDVIEAFKN